RPGAANAAHLGLPRAVADDLPALPHPAAALERDAVRADVVAVPAERLRRAGPLRGAALPRRGLLDEPLEHGGLHGECAARHRAGARPGAPGRYANPRARHLSGDHLSLLSADD